METSKRRPDPSQAAEVLSDAARARSALARTAAPGDRFLVAVGVAIAVQIAATAVGIAIGRPLLVAGGLAVFALVAATLLVRLRRISGTWVDGVASRVVLGTDVWSSGSYTVALGGAIWAALAAAWGLVAAASIAGGIAYALCGRRWVDGYAAKPQDRATAESPVELIALMAIAIAGLALLVVGS